MKTQIRRETKWSAACKLNWIQFNWIQLKWNYVWCEGKLIIDTRLKIQISYIFEGVQRMNKQWKDDEETKRNEKIKKVNCVWLPKRKLLVWTWWKIIIFLVCVSFSSLIIVEYRTLWDWFPYVCEECEKARIKKKNRISIKKTTFPNTLSNWTPRSDKVLLKHQPWLCLPS